MGIKLIRHEALSLFRYFAEDLTFCLFFIEFLVPKTMEMTDNIKQWASYNKLYKSKMANYFLYSSILSTIFKVH